MGLVGTIPGLVIRRWQTQPASRLSHSHPFFWPSRSSKSRLQGWEEGSSEPPSDGGISLRAREALLVVLEMVVDGGVSGEGGSVLHIDCLLLDKSVPAEEPLAAPSPEMKSFNIQITQMKCHGKLDKNQQEVKLTLGGERGK